MSALEVLQKYWGYSGFRACQQDVVKSVLEGHDSLVVMATGGGKSLCYQVPPLLAGKPCVVISPLISLMEDQVLALKQKGLKACFLGSAQTDQRVKEDAWAGQYLYIYCTPELAVNSVARLTHLRDTKGLSLVAVDEAHCISEWGFDFRTEYRQLGQLRQGLAGVPFLALTATATPQVADDIARNLCMTQPTRRWIMSFERPNLHFSVRKKRPNLASNFEELLAEAQRVQQGGGGLADFPPTIVYTLTRREAQDVATALQACLQPLGFAVGVYQGDLSLAERRRVHHAFLRDELQVVVATIAFGMGIDKGNVRRVYHYGAPASLEAYYQQAGRAGRDGLQSDCILVWSQGDMNKNEFIKNPTGLSAEGAAKYNMGATHIMAYCNTAGCRHRNMVEYFHPGSFQPQPGGCCKGGCDNCDQRKAGGVEERDMAPQARQLLGLVGRLKGFGLGKPIAILRGSRAKDIAPWMLELKGRDGLPVHGAGREHSDSWWKALAGLLMERGLMRYESRSSAPGRPGVTVVQLTEEGSAWLGSGRDLVLTLPAEMRQEERQQQQAAQEAAAAAAEQDAVRAEEHRLFRHLAELRKRRAQGDDVAPTLLLSDFALWEVTRKRPDQPPHLRACEGCGQAFIERHGKAFVDAVIAFCQTSTLLTAGIQWRPTSRAATAAGAAGGGGGCGSSACSQAAAMLTEAKGAALESHQRFTAGQSVQTIATTGRPKPINPMTVLGYLADAGNSGLSVDWSRLAREAALQEGAAMGIRDAVMEHGAGGLGAVKRALPSADYGHIKLVAALINCRALWFSEGGAGAGEGGSAGSGSQGPSQQALAQQAQHEQQQQQQQAAGGPPPQAQQARQRMGSRQQGLSLRQQGLAPRQLKQMRQACGSATAPAAEEAPQQAKRAKLASPAAEVGQDRECASSGQAPAVEEAGVLESPAAGLAAPAAACGAGAALKPLSRETLLRAIAESVPAGVSAVELQQRFGATGVPQGRAALAALLNELVCDFEVMRKGSSAAMRSAIDLDDPDLKFLPL